MSEKEEVVDVEEENQPYDPAQLSRAPLISESSIVFSTGTQSYEKNHFHLLEGNIILFNVGNNLKLLNFETGEVKYLPGLDHGIGAITVHPSKKFFAVGEKGDAPNVLIYEYPSLSIVKVLKEGTLEGFRAMNFNRDGSLLATVGRAPDFTLTVWNWKKEKIILRSKAFGQDVFRVSFSQQLQGQLTTSGVGHIRFWKMARTFTGLKLKGDIGKFGRVEISDVMGYTELPDGKVLSGSESGSLLLWENNLVKIEIKRKGGKPCHAGTIEEVLLENDPELGGQVFITAGHDGYIRFWDFASVDTAERDEESTLLEISPVREICLGKDVCIRSLTREDFGFLVEDSNGKLWKVEIQEEKDSEGTTKLRFVTKVILTFHAGGMFGVDCSRVDHYVVSGSQDHQLELIDMMQKKSHYTQEFSNSTSYIQFLPLTLDPSGRHVLVGFKDGVIRILKLCKESFDLVHVAKPHRKTVKGAAFSHTSGLLCTISEDNTMFFFNAKENYKPIGFVPLDETPMSVEWRDDDDALLVGLRNGSVREYQAPDASSIDSTETYEFTLTHRSYRYTWKITPPPPPEPEKKANGKDKNENGEDGGDKSAEEGEGKEEGEKETDESKSAEEGEPKIDEEDAVPPMEDEFGDGFFDKEEEEEESEKEPEIEPEGLLFCRYLSDGSLLISLEMPNGLFVYDGHHWESDLLEVAEEEPAKVLGEHMKGVCISTSLLNDPDMIVCGELDGVVCHMKLSNAEEIHGQVVHDGVEGRVTGVSSSFDACFFVSSSADGSLVIQQFHEKSPDSPMNEQPLDDAKNTVTDIVDPNAYSIQEEKLKSEREALEAAAERKKQSIRQKIQELRERFQEAVDRNDDLPPAMHLPSHEFVLDPELKEKMEREQGEREFQLQKELAYDLERSSVALKKLKGRYYDGMAVDRIVLKGFRTAQQVSSFKTLFLSDDLKKSIDAVHDLIEQDEMNVSTGFGRSSQGERFDEGSEDSGSEDLDEGDEEDLDVSKAEIRQHNRKKRIERLRRQEAKRPEDDYENPKDVAAIAWAERHMGDYKLKLGSDYVVPESQRVNAEKKRRQMILLEESIFTLKMDFNERLLALRDLKKRIVENIRKDVARVREIIAQKGGDPTSVTEPTLDDEEVPERKEEFTEEILLEFEREKKRDEARQARASRAKSAGGFGGFGGDGGDEPDEEPNEKPKDPDAKDGDATNAPAKSQGLKPPPQSSKKVSFDGSKGDRRTSASFRSMEARRRSTATTVELTVDERIEKERLSRIISIPMSDMLMEEKQYEEEALEFEKERLQKKIEKTMDTFDDAINELREEKFKLEADLKSTDLRLILLFHELNLLKEFEMKDMNLAKKLEHARKEKREIVNHIIECQERLSDKRREIEDLFHREKKLLDDFHEVCPQDSPYYDEILKIFRRKAKRKRADDEESDDEDEVDFYDFNDDASDGDDDEDEEDNCPSECPESVFETVLSMRERRMDQEEQLGEFQKSIEALKKENDGLVAKERTVDQQLKLVEKEIQEFQNAKQRSLNELKMSLFLKFSQLQHFGKYEQVVENFDSSVVFTNDGFRKLHGRISELDEEKAELRVHMRELKKETHQLVRDCRKLQDAFEQIEVRKYESMLLKFGQEVDLDEVDTCSADRKTTELRMGIWNAEEEGRQKTGRHATQHDRIKTVIAKKMQEQTELLRQLAVLKDTEQKLERELNASQKVSLQRAEGKKGRGKEESEELKRSVIMQAREIEALKQEIGVLRRKGGHVYAPIGV
eukprot:TRINITY_DN4347_c0_g1_i1.p1 TRINITY_DN4347_c0_g1~~TRINITY_DN4347_c0_g1_i1.p1  ORF type:complete len:1758 (+),score=598.58 TRINITY_DN4347_c0_g1_i1:248-5521(+)